MKSNSLIEYTKDRQPINQYLNNAKINCICVRLKNLPFMINEDDMLQYLSTSELESIVKKESFLIIDDIDEGNSGIEHYLYDFIYNNIRKYNIDPQQVVYLNSNLRENFNIIKYCTEKKLKTINVLGFRNFEACVNNSINKILTPEEHLLQIKSNLKTHLTENVYSFLSKTNREHRTYAAFKLSTSDIGQFGLISHNTLSDYDMSNILKSHKEMKRFNTWKKTLPFVIDRNNFSNNDGWAELNTAAQQIFDSTLFHIVGETHADNFNNTSLFYSEKTYKPIFYMQPFVIYGQQGINRYLKENLGFKLFEEEFDYSFDDEADPYIRFDKLLNTIRPVVKKLSKLTKAEKIKWRLKHTDKLLYNYNEFITYNYSKGPLPDFLNTIQKKY
jgi:hypothetical protein